MGIIHQNQLAKYSSKVNYPSLDSASMIWKACTSGEQVQIFLMTYCAGEKKINGG